MEASYVSSTKSDITFTMAPRGVFQNLSNIMVEHRNYISMEGALRENVNS